MDRCRCGFWGDSTRQCKCTETDRLKYVGKISGPLLDRIDIHVAMGRIDFEEMDGAAEKTVSSRELRDGVIRAMEIQRKRYEDCGIRYNSQLTPNLISRFCPLDDECRQLMRDAFIKWKLSARSYHRILRVARTVADLDGSENIGRVDILEALSYRQSDKYFK